jgi:ornithine carbamoyltransferase
MESEASVVWEQAENRMHAQEAVLALVLGGEV